MALGLICYFYEFQNVIKDPRRVMHKDHSEVRIRKEENVFSVVDNK